MLIYNNTGKTACLLICPICHGIVHFLAISIKIYYNGFSDFRLGGGVRSVPIKMFLI